jgi:uncharacterized membrane protein (Fun14 family)
MNEHQSVHELGQFHGETGTYNPDLHTTAESPFPFLEMGTSFVIGLAIGYFLKKSFKFFLLILGLGLVLLFVSGVDINGQMLEDKVSDGVNIFQSFAGKLKAWLESLELSHKAGAIAGFVAGLKFG